MLSLGDMRNLQHIKNWKEGSGKEIPAGYHIHHLIPKMDGGTDDYDNLVCVSPELHAEIHQMLGERYDDHRHLSAARLIRRDSKYNEKISEFDLDGNFIDLHDSWQAAVRSLCLKSTGMVLRVCKKETPSFADRQWRFYSEVGDIDYIGPVKRQVNRGGNTTNKKYILNMKNLKVFNSRRAAAREDGMRSGNYPTDQVPDYLLEISKEEYNILKEL